MSGYENTLKHALDLWVTPEVERRQTAGLVPKPYDLRAVQIIFYADDRPRVIRLNEEVRAIGRAKLKKGVSKRAGENVYLHEIEGYEGFRLPDDEDPNCGHFTIYRITDQWTISFDFRYNKGIAKQIVAAAQEFVDSAKAALDKKAYRAFVDTAFSAAELAAKALLITSPLPGESLKGSHGRIHARYNMHAKLGNVKGEHRAAFNKLAALRAPARYVEGALKLSHSEAETLYAAVSDAVAFASKRLEL